MKKKILALLMIVAITMEALVGCGDNQANTGNNTNENNTENTVQEDALAKIRAKGEIIIATEGTWAPWTYHDENDQLVGFDVEIANAIAQKLGVKATFVESKWDSIFAGVDAGRYDLVINGVEITEERSQKYDFTDPYAFISTVIITREDDDRINSFEDLKGMQTANTLTSTYATIAEEYGATPIAVESFYQSIELLVTKRVDATLNDNVSYYYFVQSKPDSGVKMSATSDEKSLVSIPVKKGDEYKTLLDAINQAIDELSAEGFLKEVSEKYFGADVTQK